MIDHQDERPDALAKLPALAARLGVKQHTKEDGPAVLLTTKTGLSYDVFDLVNAVLDRMEKLQ